MRVATLRREARVGPVDFCFENLMMFDHVCFSLFSVSFKSYRFSCDYSTPRWLIFRFLAPRSRPRSTVVFVVSYFFFFENTTFTLCFKGQKQVLVRVKSMPKFSESKARTLLTKKQIESCMYQTDFIEVQDE